MTDNPNCYNDLSDLPPLEVGNLRLYDNLLPKLNAGNNYNIEVQQVVEFPNLQQPDKPTPAEGTFTNQFHFIVEAPQFVLNPADVFSVSPAANSQGDYDSQLPHIILTNPHLPWERAINPDKEEGNPGTPWLCLLAFDESELKKGDVVPRQGMKLAEFLDNKDDTIFRPQLDNVLDSDRKNPQFLVNAVDVKISLFNIIAPKQEELPLLCHVREVKTDNKETAHLLGNGTYSVVVGNRFPASADSGTGNHCFLVSLEGFDGYLPGGSRNPSLKEPLQKIRFAVLASWQFKSFPQNVSFEAHMDNLSVEMLALCQPGQQCLDGETDSITTPEAAREFVSQALENGYVPLNYNPTWLGERTVAWYRGPFTPYIIDEVLPQHYDSVEAAMLYDETTGFFDLSYAVAWETGRLLAMSDSQFAFDQLKIRQEALNILQRLNQRMNFFRLPTKRHELPGNLEELIRPHFIRESAYRYVANHVAPKVSPRKDNKSGLIPLLPFRSDPKRPYGKFAGNIPPGEWAEIIKKVNGK